MNKSNGAVRLHRRSLLLAAGTLAAVSCSKEQPTVEKKSLTLNMVSSWSKDFPLLSDASMRLAELIGQLSGGQITVKVYGAGEMVGPFEVFDAVQQGTAQLGHCSPGYWRGKHVATAFFAGLPFGLNASETRAWLQQGGGQALWDELYAPFGLKVLAAGATGMQSAGWFVRELRGIRDLKSTRMRITGLGAEVWQRAGGRVVQARGEELKALIEAEELDAFEWMGPYGDLELGAQTLAKYCYFPGWQEPNLQLELIINAQAFEALSDEHQLVLRTAARMVDAEIQALATTRNMAALAELGGNAEVEFRRLPADLINVLKHAADQVASELGQSDPLSTRIYESYTDFRAQVQQWHRISEADFYAARD
jgi:TRAP-type mannitol/chloroaromatic compound transport system substrate-binding protein